MNRTEYKINTCLMICILGFFLSLLSCDLEESESVFNHLEKKQAGLGYVAPLMFLGFFRYRRKKATSIKI